MGWVEHCDRGERVRVGRVGEVGQVQTCENTYEIWKLANLANFFFDVLENKNWDIHLESRSQSRFCSSTTDCILSCFRDPLCVIEVWEMKMKTDHESTKVRKHEKEKGEPGRTRVNSRELR